LTPIKNCLSDLKEEKISLDDANTKINEFVQNANFEKNIKEII